MLGRIFLVAIWGLSYHLASSYDLDCDRNVTEIITNKGYPVENHYVLTHDGYILTIQRIPFGKNSPERKGRPPVLLQHGLLDSAHTYIDNIPSESLGFILADNGYDVWLSNSRGSTYSRRHIRLSPEEAEFWKFSWDEMADYDLPQTVDYILNKTGFAQLSYIGHSQGTEIAFVRLNYDKELNRKLSIFVALGPVTNISYIQTPVRHLLPLASDISSFLSIFGHGEFFTNNWFLRFLAKYFCNEKLPEVLCQNVIFVFAGTDVSNLNRTRLPVYLCHTPAGTSTQNIVHYGQAYVKKRFQKYDYGVEGNIKRYGQPSPPLNDVSNITTPVALLYGSNDALADPRDVKPLTAKINNLVYQREVEGYNHLDFVWGKNAARDIYPDVLLLLRKYPSKRQMER